jgi:hypothetical protein
MNPVNKILGKGLRFDVSKNNSVPCLVCKGSGKQTTTMTTRGSDKVEKFEHNCTWCNGTGQMSSQQQESYSYSKNMWCNCKDSKDSYYVPDGKCAKCRIMKHHYHCRKCGKVTQVG